MDNQKCSNCAAPMILVNNRDGTTSYKCEYCGYVFNNKPKTTTDKVFAFINRAVNALKEDDDPFAGVSQEKKAELEQRMSAINAKRQAAYDKIMDRRMKAYEKRVDRLSKRR